MRACPSSKAAVAWYWRNESILRLRLVAYLWRVRELAEGRLFRNERHVFPLVVTWGALCKFCWVEILSAWFWVGFSYWVRGSFKQGTISGVLVVRLLDWFDGRTYWEFWLLKRLSSLLWLKTSRAWFSLCIVGNESSVIENWHFPRPCAAMWVPRFGYEDWLWIQILSACGFEGTSLASCVLVCLLWLFWNEGSVWEREFERAYSVLVVACEWSEWDCIQAAF